MLDITVKEHYDLLIDEGNDPVLDTEELQTYMSKWDGEEFMSVSKRDTQVKIFCPIKKFLL